MKVCKACFTHVRDLKRLRGHLTHEAALMAANALVRSHLDYCNSLFRGLSALDLRKLQYVQNSLARIATNTTKYSHITPVRKVLHWLPIKYHSIFKTTMLVYNFLHSGNPKYLNPFSYPDIVHITLVEVNLMVCFLRFPTLLQFSNFESILDSVLHMTHL